MKFILNENLITPIAIRESLEKAAANGHTRIVKYLTEKLKNA